MINSITDTPISLKQEKELKSFFEELVIGAGKILFKNFNKISKKQIKTKIGEGVVSEIDLKSEKYIISKILKKYPDHFILAEEDCYNRKLTKDKLKAIYKNKEFTWMIDPLDGTSNFVTGFDYFSISLSLTYRGHPIIGGVYRPMNGDYFFAIKGRGAYKKNLLKNSSAKKMKLNFTKTKLKDCSFVTGFLAEKGRVSPVEFETFSRIIKNSLAIRRLGSAALDMCYCADGVFDGYWERGLSPWDVAGASVVCHEVGLKVGNFEGQPFSPFDKSIMVTSPKLKRKLMDLVR